MCLLHFVTGICSQAKNSSKALLLDCDLCVIQRKFNSPTYFQSAPKRGRDSLLCRLDKVFKLNGIVKTAMAGSDVAQSGRPIFDDFFQHLWPYIGNNTANVVFQMVKRLWLIRIDQ
ncbi:hypothetical protein TNCV_2369491 [Trichonephila clavipes]|nr:hypothetical protein TNCV_2369491 [Trichonephila clavipes]